MHARWQFAARADAAPFFLLPAVSGDHGGRRVRMDTRYAAYVSPTTRIGMRVPILYLRTTHRRRRRLSRSIPTSTSSAAAASRAHRRRFARRRCSRIRAAKRLPVLVTLNGGIWADAAGDAPEWDLNDKLEEDRANCQWNERNEVMPDDHLKHLPGSQRRARARARADAQRVRERRAPTTRSATCSRRRSRSSRSCASIRTLFVGVNLDPDTYLNPFFAEHAVVRLQPGHAAAVPRIGSPARGRMRAPTRAGVPDLSVLPPRARRCRSPTCRGIARTRRSRRGTTSIRRARSRATPRIRSGTTRGCANGRCSAAIS